MDNQELWLRFGVITGFAPQEVNVHQMIADLNDFRASLGEDPSDGTPSLENLQDYVSILNAHPASVFGNSAPIYYWFNPSDGSGFSTGSMYAALPEGVNAGFDPAFPWWSPNWMNSYAQNPDNGYPAFADAAWLAGAWKPQGNIMIQIVTQASTNGNKPGPIIPPSNYIPPSQPSTIAVALNQDIDSIESQAVQLAIKVYPSHAGSAGKYPAVTQTDIEWNQALEVTQAFLLTIKHGGNVTSFGKAWDASVVNVTAWSELLQNLVNQGLLPSDYLSLSPILNPDTVQARQINNDVFNTYYPASTATPTPIAVTPGPTDTGTPLPPVVTPTTALPTWVWIAGAALAYFAFIK